MDVKGKLAEVFPKMLTQLQSMAPHDTNNLRWNALKLESIGDGVWRIYADESVAPYMPFTNEPWTSARWNGKKNPNEGWWENAVQAILTMLVSELGGELGRN